MPYFLAAGALVLFGLGKIVYDRFFAASFGKRVLDHAQRDLGVSNTGDPARVLQMVGNYGYSTIVDWCAAAVGTWIKEAAADAGIAPPIPGSAGALITAGQFQVGGKNIGWYSADTIRANPGLIAPGMIAFWTRGDPGSGEGHTGVVATTNGSGGWTSIEGNAGTVGGIVATESHDLSSSAFIGMGYFTI